MYTIAVKYPYHRRPMIASIENDSRGAVVAVVDAVLFAVSRAASIKRIFGAQIA